MKVQNSAILEVGENCWRRENVDRGAVIVGGEDYFRAFREAILSARKRVFIIAWEVHTRVKLLRGEEWENCDDGYPQRLGAFLNAVLDDRPELHIHLLLWDFSPIYAAEREWPSFNEYLKNSHPRLHYKLDDRLPNTASHHQKIVVVDEQLAFTGGMDLSIWRWDTNQNKVVDERRTTPENETYHPYHDTHTVVTGDIALALRDLCLNRWQRATGEKLGTDIDLAEVDVEQIWPDSIQPDFENEVACLSRTYSKFEPYDEIFEIEQLHLSAISAAENYIYIENQYYSSPRINTALIERLEQEDGPDIVLVLNKSAGWMENYTMGVVRDRLLDKLKRADTSGDRLRILYPHAQDGDGSEAVYVHSKLMIVDGRFLKIGSSNLSNRSMRVDSEIDIAFENEQTAEWIESILDRLLAIHFQEDPAAIREKLQSANRFTAAFDDLISERGNSLRELSFSCDSIVKKTLADSKILDPEEPIDPGHWIQKTVPEKDRSLTWKRMTLISVTLSLAIGLALVLKYGWGAWLNEAQLTGWLEAVRGFHYYLPLLMGVFFIGGLIGVPLNLLLVASATVFGPWIALLSAVVGSGSSAIAGFGLGRKWGKPLIEKIDSEKINRVNDMLQNRSPISVAVLRLLPVAPFTLINLIAGSTKLPFRIYLLGTLFGMLPGMIGVVWLTKSISSVINNPGWPSVLGLGLAAGVVGTAVFYLRKILKTRSRHA